MVLLLAASAGLSGCDDQARHFAAQTLTILQHRSDEIAAKIGAEKTAYSASAVHAAEDRRALTEITLRNDRNERSTSLAADYDEGRKPVSQWRKDLAEYGQTDYDTNMAVFSGEVDASSRYLQTFETLTAEQDKVDALTKLLGALAKKQSLKADVGALGQFAEDSSKEFNTKVCGQIRTDQGSSDPKVKAAAGAAFSAKSCAAVLQ